VAVQPRRKGDEERDAEFLHVDTDAELVHIDARKPLRELRVCRPDVRVAVYEQAGEDQAEEQSAHDRPDAIPDGFLHLSTSSENVVGMGHRLRPGRCSGRSSQPANPE